MGRTRYMKMNLYEDYKFRLCKSLSDFEVVSTSYTKKVVNNNGTIFFNENGYAEDDIIYIINRVRNDAKLFMEKGGHIRDCKIDFYDLIERPPEDKVLMKVDLKSAYWKYALMRGVVTPETNNQLIEIYKEREEKYSQYGYNYKNFKDGDITKILKGIRLKALGSLATQKIFTPYEKGIRMSDKERVEVQITKPLYLEICRGIDDLMKEAIEEIPGCYYYYWDCIFIDKDFSDDAVEFFKNKGYDVNLEEEKLEYIEFPNETYLISTYTDKMYMVHKEDKYLLKK